ncbi:hypothetical protein [Massilia sp. Leaf139]|uniref:hypothetical protein n=1 Tax=Massilia sp. Leaf139 TaxID=1736272 RepID=UPI0006FBFC42|nr:hypothetical protein [Massilia sp. Leaf139]KQQ91595.1 hypothetical protein ASF77_06580 [Massilia sp. Leaf139]
MPRSVAIGKLGAAFAQAHAARDWERLNTLALALGPQLAQLGQRGAWNRDELAALTQLRTAHDAAAAACGEALDTLGARLADMRNNKDGWIAYALSSDTDFAGHQE